MTKSMTDGKPAEVDGVKPPTEPEVKEGGDTTPKSEGKPDAIPYERFQEVTKEKNELKTRLEAVETAQKEAETKKLEEEKKFEELYNQEKSEKEKALADAKQSAIKAEFSKHALQNNVVDPDDAYKLANLEAVEVDENNNIKGVEDIVKNMIETKPWLVQKGSKPVGSPTSPAPTQGKPESTRIYTAEEIENMSTEEYDENQEDIWKAQSEGRIKED